MTLSIEAVPTSICVDDTVACNVQVGESQVTLRAQAPNYTVAEWPPVQVAFVVETTPYDGVYDPTGGGANPDPGHDECGRVHPGTSTLCEESNGVPFFIANAQLIANAIAEANPHTNVSFALVDYFATRDATDDDDGEAYHVDIPRFVSPANFGADVISSFQGGVLRGGGDNPPSGYVYGDSDLSDNFLDSSSITALYGTIIGSGLNWSAKTHHVIVWMGSTAPRDPQFPVDYSVSPSDEAYATASTCEPSYSFGDYWSPRCEGWVSPHDGTRTDSIADLARTASTCTDSIEKVCTVDVIDLYTTPTDPSSPGWPCSAALRTEGGCPGGSIVQENTQSVLDAGCALAAATGGTWSGPEYFTCPNGTAGDLGLYTVGSNANQPNTNNPDLMKAFREVGFGPEVNPVVANGTARPMFEFVPYGAIRVVAGAPMVANCSRQIPVERWHCDATPTVTSVEGTTVYGWNWSDDPSSDYLMLGDVWSVSFLIYAASGPFGPVPVDACRTSRCLAMGESLSSGPYSLATYLAAINHTLVSTSFPYTYVDVLANSPPPPGPAPSPGPPPTAPTVGIPVSGPLASPVLVPTAIGAAAIPVQVLAVGLVAAGFIRLTVRNRSVAMAMAVRTRQRRPNGSMFDREDRERQLQVGRFE
jgi:hypothetical protein